jgi:hypothetical protein
MGKNTKGKKYQMTAEKNVTPKAQHEHLIAALCLKTF